MALIVVAIVVDLGTAGAVASVISGVVALAGLTLSVFTLVRTGNRTDGTVSANGERSVAVGGDAGRVITGDHTTVLPTPAPVPAPASPATPPAAPSPAAPPAPRPDVSASGNRAAAVGGDAKEIITGDGTHL
ncbi:hypothetical protein GCM10010503_20800 [Streptomyces lucensis JCM 4490]|uniref:Uncharacterized protein n=1 Tax=Streptomyces lucensis JCM 4490 TaxID=1306176 RepID=A0A918J248_9ACTN|nr:hypothetical protein GCM10010503_20800 [Streptomyces lucensis JCM 4490]